MRGVAANPDVLPPGDARVAIRFDAPTLRAALGEARFAAAWAVGRALSLEQAIALTASFLAS